MQWFIPHIVLSVVLVALTLLSFLHYRYDRRRKRKREAVLIRQDDTVRLVQRVQMTAKQYSRGNVLCVFKGQDVDDVIRECTEIAESDKKKAVSRWGVMKSIHFLGIFTRANRQPNVTNINVATAESSQESRHGNKVEPTQDSCHGNEVKPVDAEKLNTVAGTGGVVTLHQSAAGEEIITVSA